MTVSGLFVRSRPSWQWIPQGRSEDHAAGARSSSVEKVRGQPRRIARPAVDHPEPILMRSVGRETRPSARSTHAQDAVAATRRRSPVPRNSERIPSRRDRVGILQVQRNPSAGCPSSVIRCAFHGFASEVVSAANRRDACSAALARTSDRSTRVGVPSRNTTSPSMRDVGAAHPGVERHMPRRVGVVVVPAHAIVTSLGHEEYPSSSHDQRCRAWRSLRPRADART